MKTNDEYTGGSTTYYQVEITHPINEQAQPYTAECQDIIDALGMTFNEGNAFKALWRRCAARTLGKSKRGYTDGLYDAEKVVFYGERLVQLEQLQRKADGVEQGELSLSKKWFIHTGRWEGSTSMPFPGELVQVQHRDGSESGPAPFTPDGRYWNWAAPGTKATYIVAYCFT